ncbi:protein-L-isoaspartate O-methyltransferase family protein, partial [Burkholderia sp. SIMBA_024]|uniref:protein-L-isoaspartate O-methyltransferase family protein n=1 Tax=Burkholderia sp. SIMBA_024 TaxID=3085768 RepID=UPI00397C74E4
RVAAARLAGLGYRQVHVHLGDGSLGWPAGAPFDAIVVAAAAPVLPPALREQLEVGGRLVIPIGAGPDGQRLCRITRRAVGADQVEDLG